MQHTVYLVMISMSLLKLDLHLLYVLVEFLEELKHLDSIPLELEDLRVLLPYLCISNQTHKREVILDVLQVILWRQSSHQRDLSLQVVLWAEKDGEFF